MRRRFVALSAVAVLAACSSSAEPDAAPGSVPTSDGAVPSVSPEPISAVANTTAPARTEDTVVAATSMSSEFVELGAVQAPLALEQPGEFEPAAMPAPVLEGDGPLAPLAAPVDLVFDWGTPCSVPATATVTERSRVAEVDATLITVESMTVTLTDHPRGFELDSSLTRLAGGLGGGDTATATSVIIEDEPLSVDDLANVQRPVLLLAPDGFPLAARLRDGVGPGDDGYDFVADSGNLVSKAMGTYQETAATWITVWSLRGVAGPEVFADVAESGGVPVTNQWQALGEYPDGTVHLVLAQRLDRIPVGDQSSSGTMQFEAIVDPSTLRPDVAMSWVRVSSDSTGEVQLDEQRITEFAWADAVGCDA